ncbi:MAG TPA: glycoside hydrolase family 2 TIM barrel-domain containing protein [Candidatus Angelobacter sp.]|nr:glycoside hydrolase family 2 TIM barrel-domain containing protein [Candidatus Angelobacter sp.]
MRKHVALFALVLLSFQLRADEVATELPAGVKAVWDASKAYHETTPTREWICLNGLWRWQPAEAKAEQVPAGSWGFFKVPGCWPGITDYLQKDSQTLYAHRTWKDVKPGGISAAWYEREFSVPDNWAGRSIALHAEYLNSFAAVFVDGVKAGEIHFPGGDLDLTAVCRPGAKHRLSLLVVALPLKGVMLSYTDSASAREVKGNVERRGLCGDVFLVSTPHGPKITDVNVDTSVRKRELTVSAAVTGLDANARYKFQGRITKDGSIVKQFTSPPFQSSDLKDVRFAFAEKWMPDKLWDLNTPQNKFDLQLSLDDAGGQVLDTDWTRRFGFREFWIEGRDFYLNGKRIFLSAVPLDNAQIGAAFATYAAARESLERLQSFGINYVYTHNYGCEPGAHLSFSEVLRAADDVGMLVGFTQPHFSHYDWKAPDADENNGYARHAAFYARAAGNHPSVVMYVMSHNATGYEEDMNPDMIDGIHDGRDQWGLKNVNLAMRAEAIVKRLDPRRIVYHHASGNLGVMHDSNFYPNFAPVQELDDWFEHWATEGMKPAFTCEYGAPFTWDWTMYRGWYKGQREWGSARVPWEFCLAEWNAQFFGDRTYQISEAEKADLRWEAKQFRAGNLWHRWDYPNQVGSDRFDERYPVFAMYLTDNWRAYRTWGVSGISPWEYEHFWKLRAGVDNSRKELKVDWDNLQRSGFSPDYIDQRYERMDMAYERSDWIATPAAQALIRNNRPLLAYLAGKAGAFTSKDHNCLPGETVEKQIVVINNSRETVTCEAGWTFTLPRSLTGKRRVTVATGDQARIPLRFKLPKELASGSYEIHLTAKFGSGETQEDRFVIDVLPATERIAATRPLTPSLSPGAGEGGQIAVFDPKGETTKLLSETGVRSQQVEANTDLSPYDILVIGKAALTVDGPASDISRVRDGLKVIVFEQTSDVLEKRLGFRVAEYGLRQLFPRVTDHPILAGLKTENLHDWRGSATILPPRLKYEIRPRYGPTVEWAGIPVPRVWRCGNRGNVASVLIEKPARGDFLPILDGGFSLQYSPLMEYREGKGMVLFCQLDVTGRTESDPTAEQLVRNLFRYVSDWKPVPRRKVVYAGDDDGRKFLDSLGVNPRPYDGKLSSDDALVVSHGVEQALAKNASALTSFLKSGGNLLAIGLDQDEANAFLPFKVTMRKAEHVSSFFEPPGVSSLLAGIGPAEVHNRDPRELPLVTGAAQILGDGVLAIAADANVVFLQMAPWTFSREQSFRRTFRQTSVLLDRLLANMGVAGSTPLLERFSQPVEVTKSEKRWLSGFYLDQPEEWDDPYRFFRW